MLEAVDLTIAGELQGFQEDLASRLDVQETALRSWLVAHSLSDTGQGNVRSGLAVNQTGDLETSSSPDSRNSLFNLTCETLCRICHLLIVESLARLDDRTSHSLPSCLSSNACASDLRKAMTLLEEAAGTPICKARVMSAPLHFLSEFCKRHEDYAGLWWCHKTKEALQSEAPYLHWDALLPWCLLTLNEIPYYDADPYD
jgi:hypothetical protein